MEEIDELALFAIKVGPHDSVPLWVLGVQWYILGLFGRLEGALGF